MSNIHPEYDVYLNYHGPDVRTGFVNNLYNYLIKANISTFLDDEQIRPGESIDERIKKAIYKSRIYIPVFSKEYPASPAALDQLVKMMELRKVAGRLVIPLFLDGMDRSDVGNQTGAYGEAFVQHERCYNGTMDKVKAWRRALSDAADLRGLFLKDRKESEFIQEVVKVVKDELESTGVDASSSLNFNTTWLPGIFSPFKKRKSGS